MTIKRAIRLQRLSWNLLCRGFQGQIIIPDRFHLLKMILKKTTVQSSVAQILTINNNKLAFTFRNKIVPEYT